MASNSKSITSANPSIDGSTGFVTYWNLTLTVTDNEADPFTRDYTLLKKIETPSKKPEDYTLSELMDLFPASPETIDTTFEHHKQVAQQHADVPNSHVNDFDINNLASGKTAAKK